MQLSTVRRFTTVGEAEAARSALDAAHIAADVADENLVSVQWLYSEAIGGVKIRVKDEDREEAEQLLAEAAVEVSGDELVLPTEEEVLEEDDRALRCPACGGTDVDSVPRLRMFALFAAAFVGVGAVVAQPALALAGVAAAALALLFVEAQRCRTCGERWSAPQAVARVLDAPPPNPSDTAGLVCPRCGREELHPIHYRRFKAVALIASPLVFLVVPIWFFLAKKRCDHCGKRTWW